MKYFAIGALALALLAGTAGAVTTLSDGNSTAIIDTASQAGMYTWSVDGKDYLYQQWFWYRVGAQGGEQSIDTLGLTVTQLDASTVKLAGQNTQFKVNITYALTGNSAGSERADIGEVIKLTNVSRSTETVHFFQYSDFDLSPNLVDTGVFLDNNLVQQTGNAAVMQETTVGPPTPNHRQMGYYATLLGLLNDANPTTLTDTPLNQPLTGDVTWAYEWDIALAAGASATISKDKGLLPSPVPEPLTVLGVLASIGGIGSYLRRRQQVA
jgi:hypothetical protein